ncbi:MAG: hypothetical protein RJQ08_13595 [Salinisphaeraceae bacterium]
MDNQHRKISGYRELEQREIDLINQIKAKGEELSELVASVRDVQDLMTKEHGSPDAEPLRWINIAQTHLQQGVMALIRAVAKPEGF